MMRYTAVLTASLIGSACFATSNDLKRLQTTIHGDHQVLMQHLLADSVSVALEHAEGRLAARLEARFDTLRNHLVELADRVEELSLREAREGALPPSRVVTHLQSSILCMYVELAAIQQITAQREEDIRRTVEAVNVLAGSLETESRTLLRPVTQKHASQPDAAPPEVARDWQAVVNWTRDRATSICESYLRSSQAGLQ